MTKYNSLLEQITEGVTLFTVKSVGADLRRMAYTVALNQDAFGTLVHPASLQLRRELVHH